MILLCNRRCLLFPWWFQFCFFLTTRVLQKKKTEYRIRPTANSEKEEKKRTRVSEINKEKKRMRAYARRKKSENIPLG